MFFGLVITIIEEDGCMMQEYGKDGAFCFLLSSSSSWFLLSSLLISNMLLFMVGHKGFKSIMLRGRTVAGLPQALRRR